MELYDMYEENKAERKQLTEKRKHEIQNWMKSW